MENNKQETLEEFIKKAYLSRLEDCLPVDFEDGVKLCDKWQQEQNKYSEQEVGELLYNVMGTYAKHYDIMIDGAKLDELFTEFKKK